MAMKMSKQIAGPPGILTTATREVVADQACDRGCSVLCPLRIAKWCTRLIPLRTADTTANCFHRRSIRAQRDCGEMRNGSYSDMTDERIQKIKSAVEAADHISPEKKTEFLAVLAKLKPAIAEVAQTSEEEAESISRFVEASAHKVASEKERPESVEKVLHKLKQTVEKFEASHPQLTAFVTEYSAVLSGMGI